MPSSYTTSKSIEQPTNGSYNDDWNLPVNANWAIIDQAFGGTTTISVTGVSGPTINLTLPQYQPPNIEFSGTLSANLTYSLPSGVGGIWSIFNATTGAFTLSIASASGGVVIPQFPVGRSLIVSDGAFAGFADQAPAAAAQAAAEAFATSAASTAQSNAETFAENASNLSSGTVALARLPALPASQITSGTIANALLPNVAAGPGVIIQADPGTTPSGTFGDIFFYY